jgi:hypothetical protein
MEFELCNPDSTMRTMEGRVLARVHNNTVSQYLDHNFSRRGKILLDLQEKIQWAADTEAFVF